jgi:beta-glucanase (GH16 family)
MKFIASIFLFLVLLVPIEGISQASVKEMVETKQFVFQAQSLTPLKGSMRTLSPGYTLKVSPDTIVCDLPYVGRAFQAAYGSSDGGMKFHASEFDYTVKEKKKGWTINITPKQVSGSPRVIVSVFENGNARVVITSTDRESITYNGVINGG